MFPATCILVSDRNQFGTSFLPCTPCYFNGGMPAQKSCFLWQAKLNDGNVVGDARRWTPELGLQFFIRRSNEAFGTPTPNFFVVPDGRTIEIRSILVRPQNSTCWDLSMLKPLPPIYIRI